jgi:hypothetical protein
MTSFSTAFARQMMRAAHVAAAAAPGSVEVGNDMPVRTGFGMPFWNRLFAGAGWSLGRLMPSVRLFADGGRLLPLGIVAALPLQLSQRPNGIDFCLRHTPTLKKHQLTTSVSCSQIRYRRASQHMRCSFMYDDDGDAWAAAGLVSHPRHANHHLQGYYAPRHCSETFRR